MLSYLFCLCYKKPSENESGADNNMSFARSGRGFEIDQQLCGALVPWSLAFQWHSYAQLLHV